MGPDDHRDAVQADLVGLFKTHAAGLAGAVRGIVGPAIDVEEVLQECFLRAWRALQQSASPQDLVGWVFVLTMNYAKDLRRRQERAPATERVDPMHLMTREPEPQRQLEEREWLAAARRAIVQLDDPEKAVFLLRTSGGCSFEAVADNLGIPVGTAKTRMRAALQKLRRRLSDFAPESLSAVSSPSTSTPEDHR